MNGFVHAGSELVVPLTSVGGFSLLATTFRRGAVSKLTVAACR
jgi:hypothetical protein